MTQLRNLKLLNLKGNPLDFPPLEIATAGIEASRDYCRQRRESRESV